MANSLTAKEIASITNGKLIGDGNNIISRLSTDSRTLSWENETLFVAIKTPKRDGHSFIPQLINRGVKSFLITDASIVNSDEAYVSSVDFILVDDAISALDKLAKFKRDQTKATVVGITGSNGKTIVKEWLAQLLSADKKVVRSPRSFNSKIGVPLSVWGCEKDCDYAIFEAGISEPGEMQALHEIIRPNIGIFTHLGEAHSENFSSERSKCLEKIKLFEGCDKIIYNADNRLVDICMSGAFDADKLVRFGESDNADVKVEKIESCGANTTISYCYKNKKESIIVPFTDKGEIENALSCLTFLLLIGENPNAIKTKMSKLENIAMRLAIKQAENECIIVDDSYQLDLGSLTPAIDYVVNVAAGRKLKSAIILSDFPGVAENENGLYKELALLVSQKHIDRFIGVGATLCKYKSLFDNNIQTEFYTSKDEFLSSITNKIHFKKEAILIKGARSFHFEDIEEQLSERIHETRLEVNLSALARNFHYFRSHLKKETKMVSMVKANAYGTGDIEVSRCLVAEGVDYLAVAVADEGVMLRKAGIDTPIIVMNPERNSFAKMFEYNLEPEIYNFSIAKQMIADAEKRGERDFPFHLKLDTGMHRLGFEKKDLPELIALLKSQNSIRPKSVFSHLVGSDSVQFDDFTLHQIALFEEMTTVLKAEFPSILRHILNSAGIERFSQYQFDMVRLGIGHYGFSGIEGKSLEEVCTLKTKILNIRNVKKGETIGYGRQGVTERDSKIGVIGLGYADGLDRGLGCGVGEVVVRGKKAKIIGRVCMDVCMIDLTDIDAIEGDDVIVFGPENPIEGVAAKLNTISYEVLTGVNNRVQRIYVRE